MDTSMLVAIFAIGIVGLFWYSQNKLKGKLLCTFRRANKTKIEKLIPLRSKHVTFDGGKYNVNPKRITLFWYNRGIHQFFPTWLPTLDFTFDDPNALDPEKFKISWDTPEAREAAAQEENYRAFNKGLQVQTGAKGRFPDWLFPAITIGAIAIIGYLVYQQGQHMVHLEQLIRAGM